MYKTSIVTHTSNPAIETLRQEDCSDFQVQPELQKMSTLPPRKKMKACGLGKTQQWIACLSPSGCHGLIPNTTKKQQISTKKAGEDKDNFLKDVIMYIIIPALGRWASQDYTGRPCLLREGSCKVIPQFNNL